MWSSKTKNDKKKICSYEICNHYTTQIIFINIFSWRKNLIVHDV